MGSAGPRPDVKSPPQKSMKNVTKLMYVGRDRIQDPNDCFFLSFVPIATLLSALLGWLGSLCPVAEKALILSLLCQDSS